MTPDIQRIAGRLLLGALLLTLLLRVLPWLLLAAVGLFGGAALLLVLRPGPPWLALAAEYIAGRRGWRLAWASLVWGLTVGGGGYLLVAGLAQVASGELGHGLARFAAGLALTAVAIAPPYIHSGRQDMPDYLQLLGPGGLDAVRQALDGVAVAAPMTAPADLAARLCARVLGQDDIIEDVAATVSRRLRLRRPGRPVCVLMFAGATGAGKTELCKALADALDVELVRVDGNEMTDAHSVQRLIGAPPGYVGSDQGGQLTGAIARARRGVLLLDEIEKAHPRVMDVLMGLLDEGRLTEQSTGTTVDARDFVVVMTTNAAHQDIAAIARDEPDPVARAARVKDALLRYFRAEQLARIDAIYPFRPLDFCARVALVLLLLARFAHEAGVEIAPGGVDPRAVAEALAAQAKVADYGVREFSRALEAAVMDGLLTAREAGARQVRIGVGGDGRIVVQADRVTRSAL
ncbi:AAA family ATPase [Vulcaniibacterium gelatinicum]|uniref:AAA family ATPase n=1 Tax=Vulcaniibacterium gelatinicum TaxID=2598725 RepID=UPI0015F2BB31|nr:AAA family ATPase [Vulcaniibacterium gelatinicum]